MADATYPVWMELTPLHWVLGEVVTQAGISEAELRVRNVQTGEVQVMKFLLSSGCG